MYSGLGEGLHLRQTHWDLGVSGQPSDLKDEWVITRPNIQELNPSWAGRFLLPQTKLSVAGVLGTRWQMIKGETDRKELGSSWYTKMYLMWILTSTLMNPPSDGLLTIDWHDRLKKVEILLCLQCAARVGEGGEGQCWLKGPSEGAVAPSDS